MLDWLLGRQAEDANRDNSGSPFRADGNDAPETPAPVFAARAFKSAIFGTPGLRDEDETERQRQDIDMNGNTRPVTQVPYGSPPTKPQGILLTPGTATFRRKTVSFGAGVIDNGGKEAISKSGVPDDCPGKFPSPFVPRAKFDENSEPTRRTALIETLEAARDGKSKKSSSTKSSVFATTIASALELRLPPRDPTGFNEEPLNLDAVNSANLEKSTTAFTPFATIEDYDGDMTLDLNEPHSQSGRYWKSEYDRYHEEAIAHMTKLVKYKQLAKSYAKRKDSEAIDLGEKLKEEQQKVANMEARISGLAAQIASRRLNGRENENHDLMKDLARQTALTREYGNQVDEFQIALRESYARSDQQSSRRSQRPISTRALQTSNETGMELDRAKDQLVEKCSLRDEIHSLRQNLSTAEKKISKLQDENAKLATDMTKVSEELDNSEKRRLSAEAQSHERQVQFQTLQKDYETLKGLAKSQRRNAEDLLKKRHTQVAKLKREIRLLGEEATAPNPKNMDQATSRFHEESVTFKKEAADARKPNGIAVVADLMSFDTPPKPETHSVGLHRKFENNRPHQKARETLGAPLLSSSFETRLDDNIRTRAGSRETNHLFDSKIPTLGRSRGNPDIAEQGKTCKKGENVTGAGNVTSKHTVLTEIVNNGRRNESPIRNQSLPTSQLSASLQNRFSSLSLNSPGPALPSSEPSFNIMPARKVQDRRCTDSPRPSMFNLPSSPPKQIPPRARSSGTAPHVGRHGNVTSSRVSSMSSRARGALPSDRAAAAKARLEQKSAEKKRAQEMGGGDSGEEKENIRV